MSDDNDFYQAVNDLKKQQNSPSDSKKLKRDNYEFASFARKHPKYGREYQQDELSQEFKPGYAIFNIFDGHSIATNKRAKGSQVQEFLKENFLKNISKFDKQTIQNHVYDLEKRLFAAYKEDIENSKDKIRFYESGSTLTSYILTKNRDYIVSLGDSFAIGYKINILDRVYFNQLPNPSDYNFERKIQRTIKTRASNSIEFYFGWDLWHDVGEYKSKLSNILKFVNDKIQLIIQNENLSEQLRDKFRNLVKNEDKLSFETYHPYDSPNLLQILLIILQIENPKIDIPVIELYPIRHKVNFEILTRSDRILDSYVNDSSIKIEEKHIRGKVKDDSNPEFIFDNFGKFSIYYNQKYNEAISEINSNGDFNKWNDFVDNWDLYKKYVDVNGVKATYARYDVSQNMSYESAKSIGDFEIGYKLYPKQVEDYKPEELIKIDGEEYEFYLKPGKTIVNSKSDIHYEEITEDFDGVIMGSDGFWDSIMNSESLFWEKHVSDLFFHYFKNQIKISNNQQVKKVIELMYELTQNQHESYLSEIIMQLSIASKKDLNISINVPNLLTLYWEMIEEKIEETYFDNTTVMLVRPKNIKEKLKEFIQQQDPVENIKPAEIKKPIEDKSVRKIANSDSEKKPEIEKPKTLDLPDSNENEDDEDDDFEEFAKNMEKALSENEEKSDDNDNSETILLPLLKESPDSNKLIRLFQTSNKLNRFDNLSKYLKTLGKRIVEISKSDYSKMINKIKSSDWLKITIYNDRKTWNENLESLFYLNKSQNDEKFDLGMFLFFASSLIMWQDDFDFQLNSSYNNVNLKWNEFLFGEQKYDNLMEYFIFGPQDGKLVIKRIQQQKLASDARKKKETKKLKKLSKPSWNELLQLIGEKVYFYILDKDGTIIEKLESEMEKPNPRLENIYLTLTIENYKSKNIHEILKKFIKKKFKTQKKIMRINFNTNSKLDLLVDKEFNPEIEDILFLDYLNVVIEEGNLYIMFYNKSLKDFLNDNRNSIVLIRESIVVGETLNIVNKSLVLE